MLNITEKHQTCDILSENFTMDYLSFLIFLLILIPVCSLDNGGWRLTPEDETRLLDDGICNIDRVSILDMTRERFEREYRLKKPVLITFPNGAADWTNTSYWTEPAYRVGFKSWNLPKYVDDSLIRDRQSRSRLKTYTDYMDHVINAPRDSEIRAVIGELG